MISGSRVPHALGLFALFCAFALAPVSHGAELKPKVTVAAFGLWSDQSVFESESKGAARIVADRFGASSVVVRFNAKNRDDATFEMVAAAVQSAAKAMDVENDILFLILTSHGFHDGNLAVKAGPRVEAVSPANLVAMLNGTMVRHRVVIISACFSGAFVRPLADPDTLIITAADANHPSFGCQNGADWTSRGFAYGVKGDADHAIAAYSEAIGFDPKDAVAYHNRAVAYRAKGDNDQAIADYSEAIKLAPKDASAHNERGMAYAKKGDNDHAIADYSDMIKLDPKSAVGYNNRGSRTAPRATTTTPSPTTIRRSSSPPNTPSLSRIVASPTAPRVKAAAPSPTSRRQSGSIPKSRRGSRRLV
jgi:tetratricopeptide (TPR) repeat protein